ncbi:transcription factor [Vermiconidia calcicola]|uniref:Transcription factor n=1 Tax=Vermiconidia calcicola TaxID=1690605 RepID=A0ACC3MAY3_9PEZI|nr:transcription factor [Vermiconidia calcicola]
MVTTAALCLCNDTRFSDPKQSLIHLRAAEHYGKQFVRASSQQLQSLDKGDGAINLTCSRLLTILSFAWFRVYQRYDGVTIVDREAWTWLHMLRGSGMVHDRYRDAGETVTEALANELLTEAPSAGTNDAYKLKPPFQLIQQSRQRRFAALYDAVSTRRAILGKQAAEQLVSAIRALDDITEHLCSDHATSLLRALCTWPCAISKGYVDMLTSGHILALAVYAHWLMLVVLAEDAWFIGDMGQAGIREIVDRCNEEPAVDVERALLYWAQQTLDNNQTCK